MHAAKASVLVLGSGWPSKDIFIDRRLIALGKAGYEVFVFSPNKAGKLSNYQIPGVAVINGRDIRNLRDWPDIFFLFIRLIFKKPKQLFRAISNIFYHKGRLLGKLKKTYESIPIMSQNPGLIHLEWISTAIDYDWIFDFFSCPIMVSNRGRQVNIWPYIPGNSEYIKSVARVFDKATIIHSVCKNIQQQAITLGMQPQKGVVIYTALDTEAYTPVAHNSSEDKLRILMVGSLIWRKGYEYALLAFQKVIFDDPSVELLIVGEGPERDRIEFTIQDLGLANHVQLLGKLDPDKVLETLHQCDIFFHASLSEGIANSVVEAMACGLPVVCTDCGGMAEAIQGGVEGILTPTRDPDSAAQALIRLIDEPSLREKMGMAGRERVLNQFSIEIQANKFSELYELLLN
jgi:colanic acid/amylovoran biosynthesis glycosyltransferase